MIGNYMHDLFSKSTFLNLDTVVWWKSQGSLSVWFFSGYLNSFFFKDYSKQTPSIKEYHGMLLKVKKMLVSRYDIITSFISDFSFILHRYLLAGVGLFVLGLLIGWFTHTTTIKPPVPPSDSSDLLEELLRGITADKIDALQRWALHL